MDEIPEEKNEGAKSENKEVDKAKRT